MEQYNKLSGVIACLIFFVNAPALSDVVVNTTTPTIFTATISDNECDIFWNQSVLAFKPHTADEFTEVGKTVEIQSLNALTQCTQMTTPKLSFAGSTHYNNDQIFLDGTKPNGVGFMLQLGDVNTGMPALDTFYQLGVNGNKAFKNRELRNLQPLASDNSGGKHQFSAQQVIWVGLVGMTPKSIVPGEFSATLTLTSIFP